MSIMTYLLLLHTLIPKGFHKYTKIHIIRFVPSYLIQNVPKPQFISLYYQNVRGLRTKSSEVYLNSQKLPFDIFALTETNLTPDFLNNEFFTSDFNVFRKDISVTNLSNNVDSRSSSSGRGVLLAIHSNFDSSLLSIPNTSDLELICVKISLSNSFLYIFCCYIPPTQPTSEYKLLVDAVDYVVELTNPEDDIIIVGDFNLPHLIWEVSDDELYYFSSNANSEKEILFTDRLLSSNLAQMSNVKNCLDRQLDLVFSSDAHNTEVMESNHLLSKLDNYHPPISLTFAFVRDHILPYPLTTQTFNFRQANFVELNDLIGNINFDFISNESDIDVMVATFYNQIKNCFSQTIPLSTQKNFTSSPSWYNRELRSLRNRRNKLWKKYLKTKSNQDFSNYVSVHNNFSNLCESLYSNYLSQTQADLISNPKHFFQFINSKKRSDGYPSTLNYLNSSSSDPKIISNLFADFFSQAFSPNSNEINNNYFNYMNNCIQTSLSSINISLSSVVDKISLLKDDFSFGPDGIPPIVLKKCISKISQPLTILFQLSISNGVFPKQWKDSFIIPVYKKGSKNDISNYRPIAKLSCIPKLFESIIHDTLLLHCNQIFSPKQHGFLKGRSTTTNLTEFVSSTICALEAGHEVDAIATDFSKAFDKISHKIIVFKLKAYGFPPLLISWIESYLTDRHYTVIFRSCNSNPFRSTSGVPQGSHLGPLIFLLTVNDIELILQESDLQIYADDMRISKHILSTVDAQFLQKDLNNFFVWCQHNSLELNVNKCQAITYSRKRPPLIQRQYFINNQPVSIVTSIRDLGLICDNQLNFRDHFDSIINRANSTLGFVKRWSKEFSNPYVTKSLYISFVRPLLEYASQVWSPYHQIHIIRIEAVQRRFLRFALRGLGWDDPYHLPP